MPQKDDNSLIEKSIDTEELNESSVDDKKIRTTENSEEPESPAQQIMKAKKF